MLQKLMIYVLALMFGATTAQAQKQPDKIKLAAGEPFKHKHSKLEIPENIDGVPRSSITAFEKDHLDVSILFDGPDTSEVISIFVYREVANALPVWFDRARWAIETRPKVYGTPRWIENKLAFTPPGRANDAGLIAIYMPSAGEYMSTGVAMVPLGEWLVKIRYSSAKTPPEALAEKIKGVLAALKWPSQLGDAATAMPVEPCATPLSVPERSKPVASSGASALLGAMMALPAGKKKGGPSNAAPPLWCRDDSIDPVANVYRSDAATNSYLIAISDAGRGIRAGPDMGAALLGGDAKPGWRIEMLDLARTIAFQTQDRLPPPLQALEIVQSGKFVSSTSSWGPKQDIQLSPDAVK